VSELASSRRRGMLLSRKAASVAARNRQDRGVLLAPDYALPLAASGRSRRPSERAFYPLKISCRGSALRPSGRTCFLLVPTSRLATGCTDYAYKTASGRSNFLNRDPIEEAGGINLYRFVNNDPANAYDVLGYLDNWTFYANGLAQSYKKANEQISALVNAPTSIISQIGLFGEMPGGGSRAKDDAGGELDLAVDKLSSASTYTGPAHMEGTVILNPSTVTYTIITSDTDASLSSHGQPIWYLQLIQDVEQWSFMDIAQRSLTAQNGSSTAPNSANPKYDPTSWNDGGSRNDGVTIQGNSNCYAYATNQKGPFNGGFGMQPGDASGNPITSADDISVDGIRSRAIADGLSPTPVDGGYPVVFVVDPGVDYHWYRQDDNGLWSSKPGSTPVNNVDASGNLITDPATANRNYGPNGPNYSQYGGTLWVPPNFKFPPPYGGG